MLLTLHGVFLAYLLLLLAWNLLASATEGRRAWERVTLLPLQLALSLVLVADRVRGPALPWLELAWVAPLFPVAFVLGLAQNVHAIVQRGPRLTDIPIVLANAGLLLCTALGATNLAGGTLPQSGAALLHDHAILQHLLGTPLAALWTASWQLPLLVPRADARSLPGLLARLLAAALAAFIAALLFVMHGTAAEVLAHFDAEPRVSGLRAELHTGVLDADESALQPVPPGDLLVRVVPADRRGPLRPRDRRPLVLELRAPDAWWLALPEAEDVRTTFLDGAEALAAAERPEVLLPFPEPDGAATLAFGILRPEQWRALYAEAGSRVARVSPATRIGVRFAGTGEHSQALFEALVAAPAVVQVAGPRLLPGSAVAGGPAAAGAVLADWVRWREALSQPPELWVLAAGVSPLAYGEEAQARFVEGCLERANARADVGAILFDGWTDRGHTLGLLRADLAPRAAGLRLAQLLPAASVAAR